MTKKVVVAMSGGVDSSVAAALLKEQGYRVSGVTMRIWDGAALAGETARHACYGPGEEADIEDARRVADGLGIDFHVFDLRQEYQAEVLDYFSREYLAGRTPNPCLRCNHKVKFDTLLSKARDSNIEFDYWASGHYARVEYDKSEGRYQLKKARDGRKDQSYFLAALSQAQLGRAVFPLGDYHKDEVRKLAADFGLGLNDKPESQDFAAGGYWQLIASAPPGPIRDKSGNHLGEHRGISAYTIGQRRGLAIATAEPRYVIDIDPLENAITVGRRADVYSDELTASGLNWISVKPPQQPLEVKAKIRYHHQEAEATIIPRGKDFVYVKFQESQMAITPGQAVVFYREDVVLGGGIIERSGE